MNKSDFYYNLPAELIAQTPLEKRDDSRLMCIDRQSGEAQHKTFSSLINILNKGDLLVLNDSKVLPARLFGKKIPTGAGIQFLLLEQKGEKQWEILVKPGRKATVGSRFSFGDGMLIGEIIQVIDGGNRLVKFEFDGDFYSILEQIGEMPLPHYIAEKLTDKQRYQTVYSREIGSAAAPTAGLHFTPELLEQLQQKGVDIAFVTLHVGLGTFRPVKEQDILRHKMHAEHFAIPQTTADKIAHTKQCGGRIFGVGTTTARTLESVARQHGSVVATSGYTDIFIYPGYEFAVLDGLITNFHLPESTLIMLVSAFAGYTNTMNAYSKAVEEKYRFYSFGDAMIIV